MAREAGIDPMGRASRIARRSASPPDGLCVVRPSLAVKYEALKFASRSFGCRLLSPLKPLA